MAKRGNKASQDNSTAAPALRLSPNFQSSSADIELRSKDGVRFLVHKANLSTASTVFADMFESSTSGDQERPSIELEESAEILERLLGYCYPRVNPVWDFDVEADRVFVRAIDKYHVPRAIEAGQTSLHLRFRGHRWDGVWRSAAHNSSSPGFEMSFTAFSFAALFGLENLAALSFPFLLHESAGGSFVSNLQWLLSTASPEGLSSTDKLRLIAFLTLLNTGPADHYRSSTGGLQLKISRKARVPCDTVNLILPEEEEEDECDHAVCESAVNAWVRLRCQPVAAWFEGSEPRLDDVDKIPCSECRKTLCAEFGWILIEMRRLEMKEGLTLKAGKENEWLGEYRAWVKRKFGEAD